MEAHLTILGLCWMGITSCLCGAKARAVCMPAVPSTKQVKTLTKGSSRSALQLDR